MKTTKAMGIYWIYVQLLVLATWAKQEESNNRKLYNKRGLIACNTL